MFSLLKIKFSLFLLLFCIAVTFSYSTVFCEENKQEDIYSTPEYKAASEELNKTQEELEQIKQKAYREDPALKKAYELYEESRKFGTRWPDAWINSTDDPGQAKKDYRNLKFRWSNYFGYPYSLELSKDPETKNIMFGFAKMMLVVPEGRKETMRKNGNNPNLLKVMDSIGDPNDDEQVMSAFINMLKTQSEKAKKEYDSLLEKHDYPDYVLDIMKKEVKYSLMESMSCYYKMVYTPEYWKQAKKDYKKKIIAFSKRFPGALQHEAKKRRKALLEASEKQKAETDVF